MKKGSDAVTATLQGRALRHCSAEHAGTARAITPCMNRTPLIARQLQDTAVRYFLEVVRCGSISEASTRLSVAGSAISRQITHLEDVLGTVLFERHARGMVPSAAGELLATHALKSAHDAERVVQEIQSLLGMRRGRVRIAATEGFAMEFLPALIGGFSTDHPGVQFHLSVHAPADCTRRVLHSDADIGIVMSRHTEKDIKVEHIQPSPLVAAMRHGHPLARFKQVSLSQLLAYPIALPESDTTVRQLFDIACSRQRLAVEPVMTSNYIGALFGFLRHRADAVTVCGEISIRNQVDRGELAFVRLRDKGLDLRNIEVQTLIGRSQSQAAQAFLEYLTQRIGQVSP